MPNIEPVVGRSWSLYDPEGNLLKTAPLGRGCSFTFGEPKGVVLANSGTYTLVVTHGSVVYEPFSLRIWGTTLQTHPISIGASVSPNPMSGAGILDSPAAADRYEFTGEAGQKIYFYGRVLSSDANVEFFLGGTAGGVGIAGTFGSAEYPQNYRLYTLPYSGTFRIMVLSSTESVGEYAFDLLPSVEVQTFEYSLGQTIDITALPAGYLDPNGAIDEFTFTIPEPGQPQLVKTDSNSFSSLL